MDNTSLETFSLEAMARDSAQAQLFADRLEQQGLYTAPANLKSSILERSRQMDVRLIAGTNQLSERVQLLRYGFKVGLVAACSIAVIAVMPQLHDRHPVLQQSRTYTPAYVEAYKKIQEWNGKIDDFSKLLFNLEVPSYDE